MKSTFKDLAVGQCYAGPRSRKLRKKVAADRYVVMQSGKARVRKQRGNPSVTVSNCDLPLLGEGLRKWPRGVIEMGRRKCT